ncbi:MAG: hypothetical protein AAGK74_00065 [Chloroflexota bacterium]
MNGMEVLGFLMFVAIAGFVIQARLHSRAINRFKKDDATIMKDLEEEARRMQVVYNYVLDDARVEKMKSIVGGVTAQEAATAIYRAFKNNPWAYTEFEERIMDKENHQRPLYLIRDDGERFEIVYDEELSEGNEL